MHAARKVHILCSIDDGYAQHCCVMLCSLFRNNRGTDFQIWLLVDQLSEDSVRMLRQQCKSYGHQLEFIPVDRAVFEKLPLTHHFTAAAYFRLLAAEMLPEALERVLFLDSDLIVRDRIDALYDLPLEGSTHAAVPDPSGEESLTRLGLPSDQPYCNTGVMLMNLPVWRQEDLGQRSLAYLVENPHRIMWVDQDAINAVTHGRWRVCDPVWNVGTCMFDPSIAQLIPIDPTTLALLRQSPKIAHFTGSYKPWHHGCPHPFTAEYGRYLAKTPYRWAQRRRLVRRGVDKVRSRVKRALKLSLSILGVRRGVDLSAAESAPGSRGAG